MKRLILSLLSLTACAAAQIEVHLYNTGKVPAAEVRPALQLVEDIFRPAGIEIRWQSCAAQCPESNDIPTYVIGLASQKVEIPTPAALGFAMLSAGKGNRAAISMPRIEAFVEDTGAPGHSVLAYAIAHELGHLIARSRNHSKAGVMLAKWGKDSARRMAQGSLLFTPEDVEAMNIQLKDGNKISRR